MPVPRVLGLAATLAFLTACAESPTEPAPFTDVVAANSAPSHGGPVVERTAFAMSGAVPCATFLMGIEIDGTQVSQSWFYPGGGIQRAQLHLNQNVTFTNLSSGFALTNNSNHNIKARFDQNGNLTELVENGAPQRIQNSNGGPVLYFHIGHQVTTVDYSTSPPTVSQTFSGHSNLGAVSGPCEALGDPV